MGPRGIRRNPAKATLRSAGDFFADPRSTRSRVSRFGSQAQKQAGTVTVPVISGVVPYGLFRRYMPRGCEYITILRHPVERMIAQYESLVAPAGRGDDAAAALWDALNWQPLVLDNAATRLLCGSESPADDPTPQALERAKENLAGFALVGIEERLDEWIALLDRMIGLGPAPGWKESLDGAPGSTALPETQRRLIAERNALDLELYEFASALLDERLAPTAVVGGEPNAQNEEVPRFPAVPKRAEDRAIRIIDGPTGTEQPPSAVIARDERSPEVRFFGYSPQDLALLRQVAGSTDVRNGAPPIKRFKNLIYQPRADVLYDESGEQVPETRRTRGASLDAMLRSPPERIEIPEDAPIFDRPILYYGKVLNHWGVFHTEGISRLWAACGDEVPSDALLAGFGLRVRSPASKKGVPTFIKEFFDLAGFGADRFVDFGHPTWLAEVYVPHPSFIIKTGGFGSHSAVPERIAERVCSSGRTIRDEPVYLSRTQLPEKKKRYFEEERLEDLLRGRGVRVVHAQRMSLEDQVRLFNEHTVFIGCVGSAFHSLLYALPDQSRRSFVIEGGLNRHTANYLTIDLLKCVEANYICIKPLDPPRPHVLLGRLDVEAAEAWLTSLGAIS